MFEDNVQVLKELADLKVVVLDIQARMKASGSGAIGDDTWNRPTEAELEEFRKTFRNDGTGNINLVAAAPPNDVPAACRLARFGFTPKGTPATYGGPGYDQAWAAIEVRRAHPGDDGVSFNVFAFGSLTNRWASVRTPYGVGEFDAKQYAGKTVADLLPQKGPGTPSGGDAGSLMGMESVE